MRYLFVHAHPYDETLSTGAVLLALHHRGDETFVLTATRGEQGEIVPGPWSHLAGTPGIVEHRTAELTAALAALHVSGHAFLGTPPARAEGLAERVYEDSGMRWLTPALAGPAFDVTEAALTSAPLAEVAADIAAYARATGAEALVTYGDDGGYGHPDHVCCHRATKLAATELDLPVWVVVDDPGKRQARDVWFDAGDDLVDLMAAHRAHASQFTLRGRDIVHVGGQQQDLVSDAGLRRI